MNKLGLCALLTAAAVGIYGVGWVIGADSVMYECRTKGTLTFMGEEIHCLRPAAKEQGQ